MTGSYDERDGALESRIDDDAKNGLIVETETVTGPARLSLQPEDLRAGGLAISFDLVAIRS